MILQLHAINFIDCKINELTKKRIMKTTGIALLIIGFLLTIYTSFSYFKKEKVVDLGKIEVNANKKENVNWSPIVGVVMMVVGGVVLWQSSRKS